MIFPPQLRRCLMCQGLGRLATGCPNNKVITLEERKAVRKEENQEEKKIQLVAEPKEVELEEKIEEKNGDVFVEVVIEADEGEILTVDTHHPPRSHERLSLPTTFYEPQALSPIPPTRKTLNKISVNSLQNLSLIHI